MKKTLPLVLLAALAGRLFASPMSSSEYEIKGAFLYNFAKFAEWPVEAQSGPLTLCVLGDSAVADALEATAKGRFVDERDVRMRRLREIADAAAQHSS